MRSRTLEQWLDWQTRLHDSAIELGLERVRRVWANLGAAGLPARVVTVAGTNGKGSSVAAYENWLSKAGFRVASYTSPHLLQYNERIRRDLQPVSDDELCAAFAAVEEARDGTALTYFEFGTLAALQLMRDWRPDFAILEVGLGGRLDAVNIIDAELAHLTPIGMDHQAWLGDDREQIGFEKAGILREHGAAVINDPDPPRSVLREVERLHCKAMILGRDYCFERVDGDQLLWRGQGLELKLDRVLPGRYQDLNLAGVVAGLASLLELDDYRPGQINDCFGGTRIAGRFEEIGSPGCRIIVDVGHNPAAATALAQNIADLRPVEGRIVTLLGMLEDKQAEEFVDALRGEIDAWWLLTLDGDRGQDATRLGERIGGLVEVERTFADAGQALAHALSNLTNQDIMLVTGSFVTVELLQRALSDSGERNSYGAKH